MNDQLQENFSDGLDELGLAVPFAGEAEAGEALDTESPLSELDQSPFAESSPMAVAGEGEAEDSESFDAIEPAYAAEDEGSSTLEVTDREALSAAIARTAEQEYRRWHPASGKLRETDSAAVPILQRYYREGVSRSVTAAQLTSKAWQSGHPWSAVFVSWVMRTAGPKSGFAHSSAHQGYIRAARRNRLNGVTSNPFWAYRPTEVAPQVGDLICASRANSGATYDNIAGPQIRPTHCDIVAEVRPGSLRVIGGNVNQNVDAKTIRTLPDGRLALDGAQARFFAVVRSRGPVGAKQAAPPAPTPTPTPTPRPPVPSSTARRLVVDRHPLLRSHRGTSPDLILRWNRIGASGAIDVVVHFHGFAGQKSDMRLDRDKEPRSGLDFSDPAQPGSAGRDRPTLAILPRGNYYGGRSGYGYDFPNLIGRGALQQLIQDALARLGSATGQTFTMGRLILTGHSGGGAPVMAILAHTDPDEVEVFDGMYGSGANLVRWAERRIARELATPGALPPAMRILYRPGSRQFPGTQPQSEAVARELRRSLGTAAAARLRPFFRVDRTSVEHNDIPGRFGWRLLGNPAADLPGVKTFPIGSSVTTPESPEAGESESVGEAFDPETIASQEDLVELSQGSEAFDSANERGDDREEMAWLDTETSIAESEEFEPAMAEDEFLESPTSEESWSESTSGEGLETDGESLEAFEPERSDFDEAEWLESEAEAEAESDEGERFAEFEDERDAEWESDETALELEEESSLGASGLTPAEVKAVEITSTFETGKRGGFYGLSGNFDGQGLSFGLVNWTIGTGSLQPLLRDFAAEQPRRWSAAFGTDGPRFLQLISRKGKEAEKEQHRFAIDEMNVSTMVDGKRRWSVREPWVTYFRRLSEDQEFQKIQIRYVRNLLARADYFCRMFKLKSEQSFAFMFDTVSSHGKWWLTKKRGGQQKRRILIEQRLKALADQHGEGRVPESATLLAMADVLGTTVAQRWAANARERKRWFVTGVHRRAKELRGLEPRSDVPYATSAVGAPVPEAETPFAMSEAGWSESAPGEALELESLESPEAFESEGQAESDEVERLGGFDARDAEWESDQVAPEVEQAQEAPVRPLPEQTGPKHCRGKTPKPVPDAPPFDVTGRYYTSNPSQSVVINQAGVHIEAVVSRAVRLASSRNRGFNVRSEDRETHRQIKVLRGDLVNGREFRWFNRDKNSDSGVLRNANGKLTIDMPAQGTSPASTLDLLPMERRPTLMGTVPTLRRNGWEMNRVELNELQPLLPWQKRQIESILDRVILEKVFKAFFVDRIKTPNPLGVLMNRFTEFRVKGARGYQPETKFDQFPLPDLPLVREYARRVLTTQRWTNDRNVTRSHIDWIQIMVDQQTGDNANSYDEVFSRHLGLKVSPKDRRGEHKYEFTISLTGASLVLGGFTGNVVVTKKNDRTWGPKSFDIDLAGLNVTTSGLEVALRKTLKGYAESYLEWTENDINGPVRLFEAKVSAGLDLAKASAGFMHVLGDERMPPLEVLFWDATLGVPNESKIAEKMIKKKLQGKEITLKSRDLVMPSAGAAVLFGDISASGSLALRYIGLQKPYDPVDLSRQLPRPEAIGAEVQSAAHFCLDDDQPTPAALQALRAMCARQLALFGSGNAYLRVLGHADTLGHKVPGHNKKLSQRRADNTVGAIKGILGKRFQVAKVESVGLGDMLAGIASKGNSEPAPQYRRVDVYLNGSLELSLF